MVARLVRNEKVGGSNPPSSTTDRHPIRMSVFVCPGELSLRRAAGVPGAGGPAVGPGCSVCQWAAARWAGLLSVPVGGGPPASRPRREPPARRVDSLSGQALPPPTGTAASPFGPSTPAARLVLLCVAPSCPLLSNFARNSPVAISEFELVSLELQRFWAVFKSDRGKLRATFVSLGSCHRPWAPQPRARDSSHAAYTDRLLLSG